jgi:hypothetical protein
LRFDQTGCEEERNRDAHEGHEFNSMSWA